MALIWVLSIILIILCGVLVFFILGQDVKGGGLAGALGGGSVQSAFGTKTTETLLKITTYLTVAFFVVIIILVVQYGRSSQGITGRATSTLPSVPATPVAPAVPAAPVSPNQ